MNFRTFPNASSMLHPIHLLRVQRSDRSLTAHRFPMNPRPVSGFAFVVVQDVIDHVFVKVLSILGISE